MSTTTEISLREFSLLKGSVKSRLNRLRKTPHSWLRPSKKTPIQNCGFFEEEVNEMEKILYEMNKRLENAVITIEV